MEKWSIRKKWTELFPDFFSLSIAKKEDVLIAWQGLGYNRRALYLFESAKIITDKYNGVIPRNREALLSLPGIGSYTSGALLIFTYNLPEIIIETNIRTVYLKYFFNNIINVSDKEIFPLIEATMDYENPRYWYYLLMDIGFYIKQTEKNFSVASKHYQKQSTFEGSRRQVRSIILKNILEKKTISLDEIISQFKRNDIYDIIKSLEKDNFIKIINSVIYIN